MQSLSYFADTVKLTASSDQGRIDHYYDTMDSDRVEPATETEAPTQRKPVAEPRLSRRRSLGRFGELVGLTGRSIISDRGSTRAHEGLPHKLGCERNARPASGLWATNVAQPAQYKTVEWCISLALCTECIWS
jgi:hypothetical protein